MERKLKHRQPDRRATEGSLVGISKSKGLAWAVQWTQGRSFITRGTRLQQSEARREQLAGRQQAAIKVEKETKHAACTNPPRPGDIAC